MQMSVVNAQHRATEGRCDQCAGQCDAGKRCPRTVPNTEPGELAPEREKRPVRGSGVLVAVLCGACLAAGVLLALAGARP